MHFVCNPPPPPPPSHTLEQPPWGIYHHISFYKLCVQTPSIQGSLSVTTHTHTHSRAALFGGLPPHQFLYTCVQTNSILYSFLSVSIYFVYKLTASCTAYCQFPYTLCTNSQHPVQPLVSFYTLCTNSQHPVQHISFNTLCVQTHSILYSLSVTIHTLSSWGWGGGVYHHTSFCTLCVQTHSIPLVTHTLSGWVERGLPPYQFLYTLCTDSQHPISYTLSGWVERGLPPYQFLYTLCTDSQHPISYTHTFRLGGERSTTIPVSIHFVYRLTAFH